MFIIRKNDLSSLKSLVRKDRILFLTGAKGCGKSFLLEGLETTLVHSGGLMAKAGPNWKVIKINPRNEPLTNLAKGLSSQGILGPPDRKMPATFPKELEQTIKKTPRGLVEIYKQNSYIKDYNLLIIIDPIDKLLKSGVDRIELQYFFNLLTRACESKECSIYVIVSGREDSLSIGRDAGLSPSLVSRLEEVSYRLYPLSQVQFKDAMLAHLKDMSNDEIELEDNLLLDLVKKIHSRQDQLPKMVRTLETILKMGARRTGRIRISRNEFLNYNGQDLEEKKELKDPEMIFQQLTEEQRKLCENIFRTVTQLNKYQDGAQLDARPTKLVQIARILKTEMEQISPLIEIFREDDVRLLHPPIYETINRDTLVFFAKYPSNQKWERLETWAESENRRGNDYQMIMSHAINHEGGIPVSSTNKRKFVKWWNHYAPNAAWAAQYGGNFLLMKNFIEYCTKEQSEF